MTGIDDRASIVLTDQPNDQSEKPMTNATYLYRTATTLDGVEARIVAGDHGFHVLIVDTDADMIVPLVKCFPELAPAIAYADASITD